MRRSLLAVGLTLSGCGWWTSVTSLPEARFVEARPEDGTLETVLQTAWREARADDRVVVAQVYADWCRPCVALRDSLEDPRMVEAFAGTHVVRLQMDAWDAPLRQAILPVQELPVPSLFLVTEEGRLGESLTGHAWGDNVPAEMAPPIRAFFDEARAADAP